jgi:hypothetical protein
MEVYILNSPLVGPVKFALFDDKSVVAANTSAHMQIANPDSLKVKQLNQKLTFNFIN